jgi:hypothetical protein
VFPLDASLDLTGLAKADAPDVEIEGFDGAENLMIEVAILASDGSIVRRAVPARKCAICRASRRV